MHMHDTLVTVRPLKLTEVPEILVFRQENDYHTPFADKVSKARLGSVIYTMLKMIWHGNHLVTLVAEKEGRIVGYVTVVFGKNRKFKGNVYLVSVAVKESERGKGIGSLLFKTIEKLALERGARRIEFDVFSKNEDAVRLYERLGYEVEGRKRRAVENNDGYDDLIFMAKLLK